MVVSLCREVTRDSYGEHVHLLTIKHKLLKVGARKISLGVATAFLYGVGTYHISQA